jgi:hypothetical protein
MHVARYTSKLSLEDDFFEVTLMTTIEALKDMKNH